MLFMPMIYSQSPDLNDWANLQRFDAPNATLGEPGPGEKRIVFMGNSITEGWPHAAPEFWNNPERINRGISGQTTPQMLVRFRPDVIDLKPYAVFILAGTNDIAGNTGPMTHDMITDNIASMADLAPAHGIKVVLCSVLPAYDYAWRPGLEPAPKIVALNAWMKQYAAEKGMIYLDYHSAMKDGKDGLLEEYTYDGVHCTKEGYAVMSKLASELIASISE